MTEKLIAYKAFNADWTCRGFKYEIGKTYVHDGAVSLCVQGFHACEYPLDIFAYYPPTGQIALVELDGVADRGDDGDSKRVGKSITVKAALTIAGLVSAAIEYTTMRCDPSKGEHSTGYRSAASSTGYQSAASSTGYRSAASSTGDQSAASSTGYRSAASSTGHRSAASSTGKDAVAAAIGLDSTARADKDGAIVVAWYDAAAERKRLTVGYIGEDGIEQNVAYRCDDNGNLVRA